MDALRNYLITQPFMSSGNPQRTRAGLTIANTVEAAMGKVSPPLPHRTPGLRAPHLPGVGRKLAASVLAVTLAITAVLPAFAQGTPRKGHRAEQRQEQAFSAEARGRGKKGGKSKTVKKTFANGAAITVPAAGSPEDRGNANPYPTTIQVTGFKKKPKITDVNLVLRDLSHTFPADIAVLLVSPEAATRS